MSTTVSLADQIACVRRELAMRKNAYPKWVANGRMTQADADREIERMQAVHDTLTAPPLSRFENCTFTFTDAGRFAEFFFSSNQYDEVLRTLLDHPDQPFQRALERAGYRHD